MGLQSDYDHILCARTSPYQKARRSEEHRRERENREEGERWRDEVKAAARMFLSPPHINADSQKAAVRIKKDIVELTGQRFTCGQALTSIEFPEGERNMLKIRVTLRITGGLYQRGVFSFLLDIPPLYPFQAPKVTCITRVFHPNIDLHTGRVSLPILDRDWRPVLSINTVVFGLQLLFLEPNPDYPANPVASETLTRDPERFKAQVREMLNGGIFFGVEFPCHVLPSTLPTLNLKRKCHDVSASTSSSDHPAAAHHHRRSSSASSTASDCSGGGGGGGLHTSFGGWGATGGGTVSSSTTIPSGFLVGGSSGGVELDSGIEAMCIEDPLEGEGGGQRKQEEQEDEGEERGMERGGEGGWMRKRFCLSRLDQMVGYGSQSQQQQQHKHSPLLAAASSSSSSLGGVIAGGGGTAGSVRGPSPTPLSLPPPQPSFAFPPVNMFRSITTASPPSAPPPAHMMFMTDGGGGGGVRSGTTFAGASV